MGKVMILSGADGIYSVTYYFDHARAVEEKNKHEAELAAIDPQLVATTERRDEQQVIVNFQIDELDLRINDWQACAKLLPPCPDLKTIHSDISTRMKKLDEAKLTLWGLSEACERLLADKVSLRKRIAWLTTHCAPSVGPMEMHAVDNPDTPVTPGTYAGTVDVMAALNNPVADAKLPIVFNRIRPLYAGASFLNTRDKAETAIGSMTPAQAANTVACWPYAQKFNPHFATAQVVGRNVAANTVNIELWGNTPNGDIPPNHPTPLILNNVTVEYMQCHAAAFRVSDWVIVEFANPARANPKVIGFMRNPRKCPVYNGWRIHEGKMVHVSYDPPSDWTWTPNSGVGGNISSSCGPSGQHRKTVSWWGRVGKHVGAQSAYAGTSVFCEGVTLSFPWRVFGAFARRETNQDNSYTWWVWAHCRDSRVYDGEGAGNTEYWYRRKADGSGTVELLWSETNPYPGPGNLAFGSYMDPSTAQKCSVFVNRSGTIGCVMYRDNRSHNPEDSSPEQGYTMLGEFDLSNKDSITRTLTRCSLGGTQYYGNGGNVPLWGGGSGGKSSLYTSSVLIGVEFDGDLRKEIRLDVTSRTEITYHSPKWSTTYGYYMYLMDVVSTGHTKLFCGDKIYYEDTITGGMKQVSYDGYEYTQTTEGRGLALYIYAINQQAVVLGIAQSYVNGLVTYPYPAWQRRRILNLDQSVLYDSGDINTTVETQSPNAAVGGASLILEDYDYQSGGMPQPQRINIAWGPDDKYLADQYGWKMPTYLNNIFLGGFHDSSVSIYQSNDLLQSTFESASGATQPYNGRVAVI